jgi:hypothetical protein
MEVVVGGGMDMAALGNMRAPDVSKKEEERGKMLRSGGGD